MNPSFKVVIPARYASTRLPAKALLPIAGKAMIVHVCERAKEANAEEVIVATDDERIANTVNALGIKAIMTNIKHQSGTERIAEVVQLCGWAKETIIVNLQGDEPLIPAEYIRNLAIALASQTAASCATLAAPISENDEIFNPNAVKVVLNKHGHALYFSRAPIPWERASFNQANAKPLAITSYLRHIGMYAYTADFVQRYIAWENSPLESIESLEQLRILWHGEHILVGIVDKTPPAGVDTLEDLQRVERIILGLSK